MSHLSHNRAGHRGCGLRLTWNLLAAHLTTWGGGRSLGPATHGDDARRVTAPLLPPRTIGGDRGLTLGGKPEAGLSQKLDALLTNFWCKIEGRTQSLAPYQPNCHPTKRLTPNRRKAPKALPAGQASSWRQTNKNKRRRQYMQRHRGLHAQGRNITMYTHPLYTAVTGPKSLQRPGPLQIRTRPTDLPLLLKSGQKNPHNLAERQKRRTPVGGDGRTGYQPEHPLLPETLHNISACSRRFPMMGVG
ncbi:Hypothetical predicted protein [Pelobates cultripes]|uniref:Uncharacterized protein n=1 Tax=Pelobates cultripes TaxID=61616 RepID=A0AAD1W463_PELCU|nr:Hypothetical predicted protein [Pelobates cultripes]